MNEAHSEALDDPYDVEKRREAVLAVLADDLAGGRDEAHKKHAENGERKTRRNSPLSADLIRDAARDGKAENGGKTADDCEGRGGAGGRAEVVDNVVSDVGADGVVSHEPQKFSAEDSEKHSPVRPCHGRVVLDLILNGGEALAHLHLVPELIAELVLLDGRKQHERADDHEN